MALLVTGTEGGNSWIKQLRVLRAFRLFRLLGKMGDLKKIVTAVAMSIAPTLQALASARARSIVPRAAPRHPSRRRALSIRVVGAVSRPNLKVRCAFADSEAQIRLRPRFRVRPGDGSVFEEAVAACRQVSSIITEARAKMLGRSSTGRSPRSHSAQLPHHSAASLVSGEVRSSQIHGLGQEGFAQ